MSPPASRCSSHWAGPGYAAIKLPAKSVGTIQLKNKAVTRAKLADRAVDGTKVKDGSLNAGDLAAGAVDGSKVRDGSLTGADISGKLGAALVADGLARIQRATVAGASDPAAADTFTIKAGTATCPAGTYVVGGGASLANQQAQLVNDSYPSSATAWTATIVNGSPTAPAFSVYAICVPAVAGS